MNKTRKIVICAIAANGSAMFFAVMNSQWIIFVLTFIVGFFLFWIDDEVKQSSDI